MLTEANGESHLGPHLDSHIDSLLDVPTMSLLESEAVSPFDYYWNGTDIPPFRPRMPTSPIAYTIIIVMELVLGTMTNGTLIYLVASVRELRTSPNILLANLAIGDFIFVLITGPPTIAPSYMTTSFDYCRMNHFFYFTSFGVSSFSLTAISIERYFAIVKPFLVRRLRIMRATVVICLIIWGIACAIASYVFVAAVPSFQTTCTFAYEDLSYHIYYVLQLVFMYVLPVCSMAIFYGLCAKKLLREKTILQRRRRGSADTKARVRVSVNLFLITLVFTICWLPQYIYTAWLLFGFDVFVFGTRSMSIFRRVRIVMYYLASCINPIILYSMSSSFRQHLARKFGLNRLTGRRPTNSEASGRTRSSVIIRTPSLRSIPQIALPLVDNTSNVENHYVRTASDAV
ncbi:neuropeptide CCHamide-1 receptor-like [Lytechinus variegatus]|uniref:neuropeptide CCHamide-1 receptor-like n=1 Tax=Lytechinus variegatus TaxID=7654 RepID=UPI001BB222CF|nr:neuropeptide CCHamide-1 receptor-like [Lytechinus variegatus]